MFKLTLSRMNDNIRMGYAGAENFKDGSAPWYGQIKLTEEITFDVIVDPNGIFVVVFDSSDEEDQLDDLNGEFGSDDVHGTLSALNAALDTDKGIVSSFAQFVKNHLNRF
jgi:hypothetical protein